MKFNWGYKIATVYILFVIGIMYLVVRANDQKIDLVADNYYEEELKYQDRIDESARAEKLLHPVNIHVESNQLSIEFPEEFAGKKLSGQVQIYYPADEKKDLTFSFTTEENKFIHAVQSSGKGMHIVKLRWVSDQISYYVEKNIFIK